MPLSWISDYAKKAQAYSYATLSAQIALVVIAEEAAMHGRLESLAFALERGLPMKNRVAKFAAIKGEFECLKLASESGCTSDKSIAKFAAMAGDLKCLRYAHENRYYENPSQIIVEAAYSGSVECLCYSHEVMGIPIDIKVMDTAILSSCVESIDYAYENGSWFTSSSLVYACSSPDVRCFEYVLRRTINLWLPWMAANCIVSSSNSRSIESLRLIHEMGLPWCKYACEKAAENGYVDCLRFLHVNGCPWDEDIPKIAARYGHLQCLRYAHENGCAWDSSVLGTPAMSGHMACIEYARKNGCPWSSAVTGAAAERGDLKLLKYAVANGCPRNSSTTSRAASAGQYECFRYAYEHGCPVSLGIAQDALSGGNLECVKFVADHHVSALYLFNNNVVPICVTNGDIDCLRYLHETKGLKIDSNTVSTAIVHKQWKCFAYACEHTRGFDESTIAEAEKTRSANVVRHMARFGASFARESGAIVIAAKHSALDFMRALIENGAQWRSAVTLEAARRGHFECL